jgi:hypothetical protein
MGNPQRPPSASMGLVLIVTALFACTTRVEQVVTRYRLDLDSPKAAEGARCWDQCQGESNPTYRAWCIGGCPGVERVAGEGCQIDGRSAEKEICMTYVSEHRRMDESSGSAVAQAAGQVFVKTAAVGVAAAVNHEHQSSSSGASTPRVESKPSRKPQSPSVAPAKPSHRPAEVKKRGG